MKYFVPWRAVWKEGSVTHACRMVFDGSQAMKGGCSLNILLPKGMNRMLRCVKALRKKNLAKFIHLEIFDCDRMRLT